MPECPGGPGVTSVVVGWDSTTARMLSVLFAGVMWVAAMASRDTDCTTVTEVYRDEQPTPHIQFHVLSDSPSGAALQWTAASDALSGGKRKENYLHPRHPEVTLSFGVLADDQPQPDEVRTNRDAIIA
jgi:hypothetical protein